MKSRQNQFWRHLEHHAETRKAVIAELVLGLSVLCWGCGAAVSGQSQSTSPPPTYSISGTISPAAGGSGATVTVGGAASATTTANSSGVYSFAGLANGSYAVTPSNTGYTFSPTSQSATINGENVSGINFTATAAVTHTVALSWTPSTTTSVASYNVYRSTTNGSGYVRIGSVSAPSVTYADTSVVSGTTYYYVTTAVDSSGNESTTSNQATAAIP